MITISSEASQALRRCEMFENLLIDRLERGDLGVINQKQRQENLEALAEGGSGLVVAQYFTPREELIEVIHQAGNFEFRLKEKYICQPAGLSGGSTGEGPCQVH